MKEYVSDAVENLLNNRASQYFEPTEDNNDATKNIVNHKIENG